LENTSVANIEPGGWRILIGDRLVRNMELQEWRHLPMDLLNARKKPATEGCDRNSDACGDATQPAVRTI
jgi:hypothetical protein